MQSNFIMPYIIAIKQTYIMVDLKRLMFDMSLSQRDLAQIIGTAQSEISHFANGRRNLKGPYLQSLIAHFGKEMIDSYTIPDEPITGIPFDAKVTILSPEKVEEIRQDVREELEGTVIKKTIVLTPDIIRDPNINIKQELKKGNLDRLAKPTQDIVPENLLKVYTYCDDMEPEIRAGEPVLVQLLPQGTAIVPGQMYFIDLPSGGIIRYIEKEEDGVLYLKARNSTYGDIAVSRDTVQSLFTVRLIMRTPRALSMKESTAVELLVNKDKHLDRLLDQMDKHGDRERMLIEHLLNNK